MDIKVKTNLDLRGFLLSNYYSGDKLNLKDRVTALAFQDQVGDYLRTAMSKQLKFKDLVENLSTITDQEDLKASAREIISAARQIMEGDVSGMADFKKMVNAYPDLSENPQALEKSYARIVKAAESLNSDALDRAVDKALDEKAMYNAFRIARTEINRAYNTGVFTEASNDDDCLAMQLDLSTSVENCEICQELAERDMGAGPGIYSMSNTPAIPLHPN